MKSTLYIGIASVALLAASSLQAQNNVQEEKEYWNAHTLLIPYRLPPAPVGQKPTYIDLDNDGDPDVLRTVTANGFPVQWIDDDDDMQEGDLEGDIDNDCLMIDRNKDGQYGGYGDLIVDWVGADDAGNPAMQVVVDNIPEADRMRTGNGHYMWVIDTDKDNVFNYIDWNTFTLRCWIHNGMADFYEDYNGKSTFLKIHSSTERVNDVRMNWENPFLFYDPDNDGLTEIAIRFCDSPKIVKDEKQANSVLSGKIDWVSISMDADNDNAPGNEFDFDMTIHFTGPGFSYENQRHVNKNLRGLPEADQFFLDARWRQLPELLYPDHDAAWNLVFQQGKWDKAWFTYDEDDDCNRWERVELYQPVQSGAQQRRH